MKSNTHSSSSTSRGQTPASMTAWILSLVPSERYESAQQASVRTSSSFDCIRRSRAGIAGFVCALRFRSTLETKITRMRKKMHYTPMAQLMCTTCSNGGGGLPLQKFDNVHVAFLNIESFACSLNCASNGIKAPWLRTRSRHLGESPATFPNAQTAYNSKGDCQQPI